MATTLRTSGITMGSSTMDVSGSAPSILARAFVNFDGTSAGANKTIRSSGNVTTVVDNGIGDFTVNFITSMPSSSYGVVTSNSGSANHPAIAASIHNSVAPTTSSVRILTATTGGVGILGFTADDGYSCVAVVRQ